MPASPTVVARMVAPIALLVALLAALLPAPATASAPARTTIVIKVTGCDGCTITAYNFASATGAGGRGEGVVRNGQVRLRVARSLTRGLGFFVSDPAPGVDFTFQTLAVARYAGRKPGQRVSPRFAASATAGRQCWAGTRAARAVLRLRVDRYPAADNEQGITTELRPYFTRSLRSVGSPWAAPDGTLGTQSTLDCSGEFVP